MADDISELTGGKNWRFGREAVMKLQLHASAEELKQFTQGSVKYPRG